MGFDGVTLKVGKFLLLLPIPFFVASGGCAEKVVLKAKDGKTSLVYKCSDIEPQAESLRDQMILAEHALVVAGDALKNERLVSLQAIDAADKTEDIRKLEFALVEYSCKFGINTSR